MMYTLNTHRRRLRPLLGLLALVSGPLAAMEELTVNGAADAAVAKARQASFESQMELYAEAVGVDFKAAVELELRRLITPPVRLAAARAANRG